MAPQTKSDAKEMKTSGTNIGLPQSNKDPLSLGNFPMTPAEIEDFQQYTDPNNMALAMQKYVEIFKTTRAQNPEFSNFLEELQYGLRYSGISKGSATGFGTDTWTPEDTKGFKWLLNTAYSSNQSPNYILAQLISSTPQKDLPKTTFSKTISTAVALMDKGDATKALSKAMYQTFGYFPSEKQIVDFQKKWNIEAERQKSQTVTSSTTTSAGQQVSATTSSKTMGQGFTEAEKADFLAQYLQKNFNVKKGLGGEAKVLYDTIANTYKNNLLPVPSFDEVTKQVVKLIGTGDSDIQKQQIADMGSKIRRQAAALFPGWKEYLDQGDDLMDYASNYAKFAGQKLGREVKADEDIVRKIMSFSDIKGPRPASSQEITKLIESTNEWQGSSEAKGAYIGLANLLTRGL